MNQYIGMRVAKSDCHNLHEVVRAAAGSNEFADGVEIRVDETGAAWAGAADAVRTAANGRGYFFAAYTIGSGVRFAWVDASNWSILRSSASKSEILSNPL